MRWIEQPSAGIARRPEPKLLCMASECFFRHNRLDADPRHPPDSRGRIKGAPSSNARNQDKGARVFAAIVTLLFACYLIGALTTHAQENNHVAKYGTPTGCRVSDHLSELRRLRVAKHTARKMPR